ncbi:MAG TPA: APC family permease [Euryarchaeota archaeon]|nr:inner membrane transport protein YbaT [archaeon BMS3Bbin15]HDL15322.1 APC family permease [Euryarchaeota archaeon]
MSNSLSKRKPLGYWSVVSIGIGGMVGGGIFAVLGLAVQLSHGGTPVAFAVAGIVALVTSYSYSKLSVTFPSQGGTVEFLNQAFGTGLITGGLNILLLLSYIVMLSLYAFAFGSYGASFFPIAMQPFWKHVFITGIIILLTGLNILGAKIVGKSEEWIVALKITILFIFIGAGLWSVDPHRLQPSTWTKPLQLIAGGMIIFLAYEGFELIANTAGDVRNPRKTLPRAYYSTVGFVIALYVLVSLVTVGNLPIDQIVAAKDYALAASAKPFMGSFGFILIAIAALLSTGSAINATLYGTSRVSYIVAKEGELPERLEDKIWNRPIEGLLITSILTLLIANLFNLSSISIMGSAGFLLIFAAVNTANLRLYKKTASHRVISAFGIVLCLGALVALIWQVAATSPGEIWILAVMIGSAFTIEKIYRKYNDREIRLHKN